MSHSTVLVVVEDATDELEALHKAEEALEPFNENIEMEPTVNGPVTASDLRYALDKKELTDEEAEAILTTEDAETEEALVDYYGRKPEFIDGRYMEMTTYNPKSKWDWYSLGGRWDGIIPKKGSARGVNVIQKKDLDLSSARAKAEIDANNEYDGFEAVIAELGVIAPGPSWDEILESFGQGKNVNDAEYDAQKVAEARQAYQGDVWRSTVRTKMNLFMDDPVERYFYGNGGRKAFVENAVKGAFATFAVLDSDGEWWERGDMGWFGMVSDEIEKDEWLDIFGRIIDNSSDDTWFLLYDVHI